ncbi:MAG: hypothetical protein NTV52_01950, partial [Acidobacteria bacterium]|nr:hypothetical protein [Acidobacteriota bacterium]
QQEQDFNNDGREELALVDVSNSDIFNIDIDDDKEADKEEQEDGEEGGGEREKNGNGNQKLKIECSCDANDASSSSSSSSCSSRSSHTTNESLYNMSDDGSQGGSDHTSDYNGEDEETEEGEEEGEEEEILNATIYNFPVEVIALERCTKTLDDLMVEDVLSDEEWEAALMQIVITLATY